MTLPDAFSMLKVNDPDSREAQWLIEADDLTPARQGDLSPANKMLSKPEQLQTFGINGPNPPKQSGPT